MTRLRFEFFGWSESRKTRIWRVISNIVLGVVRWHAPWRKYVFESSGGMIYDAGCLCEIAEFCKLRTEAHRNGEDAPEPPSWGDKQDGIA